jgi:hypothetical protein
LPRVSAGRATIWDWLTAVAGVVLIVSQFMTWWTTNEEPSKAALELGLLGKLVFVVALLAIATPFFALRQSTPHQANRRNVIMLILGLLTTIFFIVRGISDPPELDTLDMPVHTEEGVYVGIAAAGALVLFSLLGIVSRQVRRGT